MSRSSRSAVLTWFQPWLICHYCNALSDVPVPYQEKESSVVDHNLPDSTVFNHLSPGQLSDKGVKLRTCKLCVCLYVCICMCVCLYVRMYLRMYMDVHVYMY